MDYSPFAKAAFRLCLTWLCAGIVRAEDTPANSAPSPSASSSQSAPAQSHGAREDSHAPAAATVSVTKHTVTIGGKAIEYKVTAGYLILKDEAEKPAGKEEKTPDAAEASKDNLKPKAKVFYVAYTIDGADPATRPVTFAFNGGPGAASVWLHLGALGPRRVKLTDIGDGTPPPYRLLDNQYSWLDQTDLVFIDPVSTGYSRPVAGETAREFHGFYEDLSSVAEVIRHYTTQNNRWPSPKFIVGESYGGARAAAIAGYLQDRMDIYLNGVVIVSGVLSWQTLDAGGANDLPYTLFLPSFASAAWYHKKLAPEWQDKPADAVRQEAENLAGNEYLVALARGSGLSDADRDKMAHRLASVTGLPVDTLLKYRLKISPGRFMDELLKDEHRSIGRFDSRLVGIAYEPDGADFEPSFATMRGVFAASINTYLRSELKFESELPYEILANVGPWNFSNSQNRYLDVTDSLAKAMNKNPKLKVWVVSGYYDLAVPYFATDHALRLMHLEPSIKANLSFKKYDGGHMVYTQEAVLKQFDADFDEFIAGALK